MHDGKRFQRVQEDFVCLRCHAAVKGRGYTNHCPACLYSRHVDIHPGDRAALCGGLMEPVGLEVRHDSYIFLHRCLACGFERKNKASPADDSNAILNLARRLAQR